MGGVLDADCMGTTSIVVGVIRAETFLTESTSRATGGAKPGLALRAWFHRQRPALTTGTFNQTLMAIGLAVNRLIKAGANYTLTGRTTDKTILTEPLSTGATSTNLGAVLFAAGAAHGAFTANVGGFPRGHFYLIDAQMAATLTHATMAACLLASMTNFIAADGAKAAMVGAGAFPTGPAKATTGVTVGFVANGTERNGASGAEQILTTAALAKAVVADEMTVAVQHHLRHFVMADMTTGPRKGAIVTIAQHLYSHFPFAVAQGEIGYGHWYLQDGVAKELHLYP